MSFSYNVKTELCKNVLGHRCCMLAECYGILLYCNTFSPKGIRIVTEHPEFAARIVKLFRKAFSVEFDEAPQPEPENGKYVFQIDSADKIRKIYASFGLSVEENITLHLNRGILENECCDVAFIRGAFLAGGSVIDPAKRYHLELTTTHGKICAETYSLLLDLNFAPKDIMRNGLYVLYFKQSDQIEDFLTSIGAPVCAMEIMEAKVEKQMRNKINRVCNCDLANLNKTADAAQEQIAAIYLLRQRGQFDSLPEKVKEVAVLREKDPHATLSEMAEQLSLSKSAVNHRMRKIMELARS